MVCFVGAIIIENDVDGFTLWHVPFDLVEEADEFLMPVALHVLPDDRSVENIECGKQHRCVIALVIVGHGRPASLVQWQTRLGAVKRL